MMSNNQTNYQFTSVIVTHFMNGAGVCRIIRRTVFNIAICLNYTVEDINNQIETCDEKSRHPKTVFFKT